MRRDDPLSATEVLGRLVGVTGARMDARASEAGLSSQQMRLLGILRDRTPGINELAAHLGLDKSSMSGLVIRAERRGLVSRTKHERDGRAVRVRLEPAGRALIDAAISRFEGDAEEMFAALTEVERDHWVALTTRLVMTQVSDSSIDL